MLVNFQKPGTILFSLFTSIFFFSQIRAQNISNDPGQLKIINDRKDYENQVKAGQTSGQIGRTLETQGVVRSARAFAHKRNTHTELPSRRCAAADLLRLWAETYRCDKLCAR